MGEKITEARCRNHPHTEAAWRCTRCGSPFCGECARSFGDQKDSIAVCPSCGERCESLSRSPEAMVSAEASFWERLPGIFAYPLRKDGPFILAAGAFLYGLVDLVPAFFVMKIIFWLFMTGYLLRYYLSVVSDSATGSSSPPTWPEFEASDFFLENLKAIIRFLAPAILSYAPAIVHFTFGSQTFDDTFYLLLIAGSLSYPMSLTAVAVFEDTLAVSPLLVIPSILRVPLRYLATCFIFIVVLIGLNHIRYVEHVIPVRMLRLLIRWFVRLYLWTLAMHLLGMFYYTSRHKLRWM